MERERAVFTKRTQRTPSEGAGRLERPILDIDSGICECICAFDKPKNPKFLLGEKHTKVFELFCLSGFDQSNLRPIRFNLQCLLENCLQS